VYGFWRVVFSYTRYSGRGFRWNSPALFSVSFICSLVSWNSIQTFSKVGGSGGSMVSFWVVFTVCSCFQNTTFQAAGQQGA
jgi:hypothetical protein